VEDSPFECLIRGGRGCSGRGNSGDSDSPLKKKKKHTHTHIFQCPWFLGCKSSTGSGELIRGSIPRGVVAACGVRAVRISGLRGGWCAILDPRPQSQKLKIRTSIFKLAFS